MRLAISTFSFSVLTINQELEFVTTGKCFDSVLLTPKEGNPNAGKRTFNMWTKTKGTAHVYKKAIEQTPLNVSFVSVDEGTTKPNGSFSRGFSQESMLRISIALQSTGAVVGFVVELKLFADSVNNKVERSHVPMNSITLIHESWNFDS